MKKDLFREIKDGDDCTDIKALIAVALAGGIFLLLAAGASMYHDAQRQHNSPASAYGAQLRQLEADPEWVAEQKRLARKHGPDRVIMYESGQTPWYWCGPENTEKCKFQ